MKQRLWVPIAAVLAVLLAGTVAAGFFLRDRLEGAAAVLDTVVDPAMADTLARGDDLGVPVCGEASPVLAEVQAFHLAVAEAQDEARAEGTSIPELVATSATFDSFLLETATARSAAGTLSLVVRARPDDGAWCVDEVEFLTED